MGVQSGIKRTAVMCILKSGDQLLLLQRRKAPNQGLFTPIGGKLDPHEGPTQAAIRETMEETGISVNNYRYLGSLIETAPTSYNWNCLVYLAEIPWQPAPPCNEGELHWIAIDDLLNVPTPPTDWYIYKYMLEGKPFMFNAAFDEDLKMLWLREEIEGVVLHPANG